MSAAGNNALCRKVCCAVGFSSTVFSKQNRVVVFKGDEKEGSRVEMGFTIYVREQDRSFGVCCWFWGYCCRPGTVAPVRGSSLSLCLSVSVSLLSLALRARVVVFAASFLLPSSLLCYCLRTFFHTKRGVC